MKPLRHESISSTNLLQRAQIPEKRSCLVAVKIQNQVGPTNPFRISGKFSDVGASSLIDRLRCLLEPQNRLRARDPQLRYRKRIQKKFLGNFSGTSRTSLSVAAPAAQSVKDSSRQL